MRNDPDPASPFGWNGASFWSVQHHTSGHWLSIGNGTVGAATGSISGEVFNDTDGDGLHDPSEDRRVQPHRLRRHQRQLRSRRQRAVHEDQLHRRVQAALPRRRQPHGSPGNPQRPASNRAG
jgi:hypothetical protein